MKMGGLVERRAYLIVEVLEGGLIEGGLIERGFDREGGLIELLR